MSLQQRQTGAGVVVKINGNVVGFATSITYQRTVGAKVITGIDSPFAAEIALAGPYQCTGTMSGFRMRGSGGLDGAHIMNASSVSDYFNQQYVSIEIIDRLSGASIVTIYQAMFIADSWSMNAKDIISFTANFIGIFMQNELSTQKNGSSLNLI
jgi:hypothetical protein